MRKLFSLFFLGVLLLGACAPKGAAPLSTPASQILSATQTPSANLPAAPTSTPTRVIIDINPTQSPSTEASTSVILENDECDNPFYPVVDGSRWQYKISTGSTPEHSMSAGADKTFTIKVEGDKNSFTISGSCTDDGIILMEVPGISSSYSGEAGSSTLTTTNDDGVTLPNDVQVGDEWSQTIRVVGNGGEGSLSAQIDTNYSAIGYEIVSTPIGPINALKVEQTGSLTMGGRNMLDIHGYIWYGQGIGVVKNTVDGSFEATLVTYDIPQP